MTQAGGPGVAVDNRAVMSSAVPPSPPAAARAPSPGLSLQATLHALVAGVVGLFLAALLWLQIDATRAGVREEIVAANRVAAQLLERVSWIVSRSGPDAMLGFLAQLGRVRANDLTLHAADGHVLYRSPAPTYKQGRSAPAWFHALVAPNVPRQVIELAGGGRLTLEADPSRAILDGWDDLSRLAGLALAALGAVSLAVYLLVGRTVRPFAQVTAALAGIARGDYATRLPPLPGREARLIGEAVNHMGAAIESGLAERMRAFEAERRLAESQDWARQMQARLEAERKEIAAELHDELGQSVTAIRSLARSLVARLPEDDPMGREAARLIDQEAAQLYDAMHGLIPRLTPLSLSPLGLGDALTDLLASLRQRHRAFEWQADLAPPTRPVQAAVALAAYRVVQEAANNAVKHSGARRIRLGLAVDGADGALTVTVDDDGCGLPPEDQRPARFGLSGLRERVVSLGGQFSARRRPDCGSHVQARWPGTAWVATDAAAARTGSGTGGPSPIAPAPSPP